VKYTRRSQSNCQPGVGASSISTEEPKGIYLATKTSLTLNAMMAKLGISRKEARSFLATCASAGRNADRKSPLEPAYPTSRLAVKLPLPQEVRSQGQDCRLGVVVN
jgi:hypothetical protein